MNYYKTASIPQVDPKDHMVALVTGVSIGGIGFYTSLQLYSHGYIVYIAGRNPEKTKKAHEAIKQEAMKRYAQTDEDLQKFGEIHELKLDLTSLKNVKNCAEDFLKKESKLDLLIDNAGLMAAPFSLTEDGFEIQVGTNYIGHVLLDELLLSTMEKSSKAPRLVVVSSLAHNFSRGKHMPDETFNCWPNAMYTWYRYAFSKLLDIQYAKMTAINHPKVLSIAVHPGVIVDTGLYQPYAKSIGSFVSKVVTSVIGKFLGVDAETGALSTLRAATSPELTAEANNGIYLTTGGPEIKPSQAACDLEYANKTYTWTLEKLKSMGYL